MDPVEGLPGRADPSHSDWEKQRLSHGVVLFVCASLLAGILLLSPVHPGGPGLHIFHLELPPACTFRALFDLPCPGCGLTRSLVAAAHGDLADSWTFHRLGALTLLYILLQAGYRLGMLTTPSRTVRLFGDGGRLNRGIIALAALFGGNWLLNLALLF